MPSIVTRRWPTVSPSDCIFDEIVSGVRPAHVVLDEPELLAFLDARPVFEGHTLVVPRHHVPTLSELPAAQLGPLLEAGRRVSRGPTSGAGGRGHVLRPQRRGQPECPPCPSARRFPAAGATVCAVSSGLGPATTTSRGRRVGRRAASLRHADPRLTAQRAGREPVMTASAPDVTVRTARTADAARLAALLAGGTLARRRGSRRRGRLPGGPGRDRRHPRQRGAGRRGRRGGGRHVPAHHLPAPPGARGPLRRDRVDARRTSACDRQGSAGSCSKPPWSGPARPAVTGSS